MRKIFFLASVALISLFYTSCNPSSNSNSNSILDTSIGKTSEVLVVMSDGLWTSSFGDTVRSTIGETAPWLYIAEPRLDISWVVPKYFEGLYTKYRNVLIIEINPNLAKNQISVENNAVAKPQSIVRVKVKSKMEGIDYFVKHHREILNIFNKRELDRIVGAYKGIKVQAVSTEVEKSFGFEMVIPKGFYVATNDSNFMWLRKPTRHIDEAILIYRYPYTDTTDFNPNEIIKKRNEITIQRVPGPIDSSYMKVSDVFPAYSEEVTFNGKYAMMMRSWWDVTKYPLGGPYISYTFVDPSGEYLICVDGYIHAPKKPNKRDILLHLESIFSSLKYTQP